jgi:hypothetical protein
MAEMFPNWVLCVQVRHFRLLLETTRVMEVIHHRVNRVSDWPPAVQGLAHLLTRTVPPWVATGPHPFISAKASELLPLLAKQSLQNGRPLENGTLLPSRPLTDVFDLVLSTAANLLDLTQADGYLRPTVPLASTLVKSLACACFEEASAV